jgi:hypothetical protein
MRDVQWEPEQFAIAFKSFIDQVAIETQNVDSPLIDRIATHLDTDLSRVPVIAEEFESYEHPNLQRAIDFYTGDPEHHVDLVGIGVHNKRFMSLSLSDILSMGRHHGPALAEGPIDYVNYHLANDEVLPCVNLGVLFIRDDNVPLVAIISGANENGPHPKLEIEVAAASRESAQAFLAEIIELMDRLNVYRGHVVSLAGGDWGPGRRTLIAFHSLPRVERADVILPLGVLERVERQTIVFAENAERLSAAGRSLKRGLLLFGPPGVGKTLTVQYLAGRMPGRTVILTAGTGMGMLQPAIALARTLSPSMVVLEDVDLIAENRGMPFGHSGPLLFSLLNEMDGLQEDSDVIFILTTNRADILEPALAARPGRIDLAVEYPLPDRDGRLRLLALYARGIDLKDVDLLRVADRIDGASPAYIKELLRKAVVLAAEAGGDLVVTQVHLVGALDELDAGGALAHRLLGFRAGDETELGTSMGGAQPAPFGFPFRG